MPIYEYRCDNDHTFEAFQSMSEDPLAACEVCGASARRVLHAPAVHFKGSGFYTTDYARKGGKPAGGDGDAKSGDSSDKGGEKKSESSSSNGSKSDTKAPSGSKG